MGLDVYARSVVACAIDDVAGEIRTQRVSAKTEAIVEWVRTLAGPVAVTYEANPTGFGLARALAAVGAGCVVVAPSKLERRLVVGSRPTAATPNDGPGCCGSGSSRPYGCPPRPRRPLGIWCVPARTPAGI